MLDDKGMKELVEKVVGEKIETLGFQKWTSYFDLDGRFLLSLEPDDSARLAFCNALGREITDSEWILFEDMYFQVVDGICTEMLERKREHALDLMKEEIGNAGDIVSLYAILEKYGRMIRYGGDRELSDRLRLKMASTKLPSWGSRPCAGSDIVSWGGGKVISIDESPGSSGYIIREIMDCD